MNLESSSPRNMTISVFHLFAFVKSAHNFYERQGERGKTNSKELAQENASRVYSIE